MKSHDIKLKNELLSRGLLKADQVQKASDEILKHKTSVREAVLKLGYLREEEVLGVEADILTISFLDLDKYLFINEKIIKMVPEAVARANHVIPVFKIGKLTVATCDSSNLLALDEVRDAVGEDIDIVLSTRDMIDRAIEQYYGGVKLAPPPIASDKHGEKDSYQIDKAESGPAGEITKEAEEMPIIKMVNSATDPSTGPGVFETRIPARNASGTSSQFRTPLPAKEMSCRPAARNTWN